MIVRGSDASYYLRTRHSFEALDGSNALLFCCLVSRISSWRPKGYNKHLSNLKTAPFSTAHAHHGHIADNGRQKIRNTASLLLVLSENYLHMLETNYFPTVDALNAMVLSFQ